ncbi:glycine zipper 2TM domain-containing protein [Sphingomonas sp. RHCKR7]|uniref:glycine zipper 2TM domain-containing protein n=1 Tax=Sphingomonas folli TaxID=2862497 RepID=UPI001CA5205D|nr:glycine zipper 2TM domain-containing protein [Sphingomonas folli]MBW6526904.1 glycine zipper 2TM domain-containing protein [Sphingomonas folli]
MNKALLAALALATATTPMLAPAAQAQRSDRDRDYRWHGDDKDWEPSRDYRRGSSRRERALGRDDQIYRGRDGRAYCKRNDGTTGLVIGGVGGGVLGNLVGGGTLGTLLGAGGGALLGRSIDRGKVKCR